MIFLIYSQINVQTLAQNLGLPQYSYFFVLDKFIPVLERIGKVIVLGHPDEADKHFNHYHEAGETCLFLSFTPPDLAPTHLHCPTLTVFAWEFSNLPNEVWDENPNSDWCNVFRQHAGAIPLSTHSEKLVREAMGNAYPVKAIPVPVWDSFEHHRKNYQPQAIKSAIELLTSANVIDTRNYIFSEEAFYLENPIEHFNFPLWDGQPLEMRYTLSDEHHAYLGGFYPTESWGTWSRLREPWILVPTLVSGEISLEIECAGYGNNADRLISILVGDEIKTLRLTGHFHKHQFTFDVREPINIIRFHGLSLEPVPGAVDPRTMGLGLMTIQISRCKAGPHVDNEKFSIPLKRINLDGVVYTSVFNPADYRKNWIDIITAFCFAFKECSDATLILKFTHRSLSSFLSTLHYLLEQMHPFKCRVIALHGYFEQEQFEKLIACTSYYVNASTCEGLCLPIMEFMSCGVPALAPKNTAMEDYVSDDTNFIIDSSVAPTIWPQDPRQLIRTLQYRISWESIVHAYQKSYYVAKNDAPGYLKMSSRSILKMKDFCSLAQVESGLRDLLARATT